MKNNQNNKIIELAEFIALEHDSIVTPLETIALEEDLQIIYDSYEDAFDGLSVFDSKYFIHLNTDRGNTINSKRGRFTLAHELGHYFITSHRTALYKGKLPHPSLILTQVNNTMEREADLFASTLLMPTVRFKEVCQNKIFDYSIIKELSNTFNVSITATAIRFTQIGNHPICIIYSHNNKPIWYYYSSDFRFKKLLHNKSKIPINTLAGDFYNKGIRNLEEIELEAEDWFLCFNQNDRKTTIIEKSIFSPNNSALSIIWQE
ncbi:MAG: ImmA/IrrE family metallo-endopeptidase [Marinifilaceae bacterium]